jgi:hypothetical protein
MLLNVSMAECQGTDHRENVGVDQDGLQRLLDEAACRSVLMRYGAAVDWKDRAVLELLFWPDADVNLGFFKGPGSDVPAFLIENANRSLRRCHITTNVDIRLDGDTAHAESCAITHAVSGSLPHDLVSHLFVGRYLDRLERRGAEWRFASRHYLLHGARSEPYAEDPSLELVSKADGLAPEHPLFRHV